MSESDEVVIAVMGATGTGKTSFINLVSESQLPLSGRAVTLLDTPGFNDSTVSDTDVLKMLALYLSTLYSQGIKLYGIIYMHRISDFRVGGSARKNFNMFRKLCGEDALPNVVILTSMWGEVTPERGAARELELATDDLLFKPALDSGARMLRYEDSVESARFIISSIMNNSPRTLRIQEQLVDAQKDIADTDAGQHLQQELTEFVRKHRAQLVELQEEMNEALQAKDMQSKKELERVRADLEERISQAEHDRARLNREFAEEKRKTDDLVQEAMSLLRQEQRSNAEAQDELKRYMRLADSNAASFAADKAFWEESLRRLEAQRSHEALTVLDKVLAGVFMIVVPIVTTFAAVI